MMKIKNNDLRGLITKFGKILLKIVWIHYKKKGCQPQYWVFFRPTIISFFSLYNIRATANFH